jgi:hypothetical protein
MSHIVAVQLAVTRGSQQIFGTNGTLIGGVGEPGVDEFTGGLGFMPVDILLKNYRFNLGNAIDGGTSAFVHYKTGNNTGVSSIITITNPAVETSGDIEATLPGGADNYLSTWTTTTGSHVATLCTEYQYAAHRARSFYQSGNDFAGVTLDGSDHFMGFDWTTTSETVVANAQTPWPVTGRFLGFIVMYKGNVNDGSTIEVALQKNGVDTALLKTLTLPFASPFYGSNLGSTTTDLTTAVSVTEGDLLNWRVKRTSGGSTLARLVIGLGFS